MENRIIRHLQEKAPAYALAVVVGLGSLALMADNGEHPGSVTSTQHRSVEHDLAAQDVSYDHVSEPDITSPVVIP